MEAIQTTQEELTKVIFTKLQPLLPLPRELSVMIVQFYIPQLPPFDPNIDSMYVRYINSLDLFQGPSGEWVRDVNPGKVHEALRRMIQEDALEQAEFCSGGETFLIVKPQKVFSFLVDGIQFSLLPGCVYGFWGETGSREEWSTFPNPFTTRLNTSVETTASASLRDPQPRGIWPVLDSMAIAGKQHGNLYSPRILSRSMFHYQSTRVLYDGIALSFLRENGQPLIAVSYVRRELV